MSKGQKFFSDDTGTTTIEYALIAVLCSTAIISGLADVRNAIAEDFDLVASTLSAG
ncbi:MAG: Flp family type IVb pilin [Hyphomicrobium sp.]